MAFSTNFVHINMNTDTHWWTNTPQPFNFPIWAVLDQSEYRTHDVQLLREPAALDWVKIKAWMPAQVPTPPMERWEVLANEYFQNKLEANEDVWGARDWFMEGVRYGKDQTYIKADSYDSNEHAVRARHACTQDEFKEKYGEYGEKYKPQTDPKTPWDPIWDTQ